MTVLVLLENHLYKDKTGKYWCDRIIDYNYLKRYLMVFENVTVCARVSFSNQECKDKLLVSGSNVDFQDLPDFIGIKGIINNYCKIIRSFNKALKQSDCVIMRCPTHLSLITYKKVLKSKKKIAIEMVGSAEKMIDEHNVICKALNKLICLKTKKICRSVNGVAYVTKNKLQDKYPCNSMISKNQRYFTSNYSSIDLELKDYCYPNVSKYDNMKTFKIIHTGYMDSMKKGHITLLKAVKKLLECGNDVELYFIGDGRLKNQFINFAEKEGISDKVKFLGMIKDKKKLLDILSNMHLFAFPTHTEGLPRAVIEAMSVGLPCISSPVDGIPELLSQRYLVNYNDYEGYADLIEFLISNPSILCREAINNYKKSHEYEKSKMDNARKKFYMMLKRETKGDIDEKNKKSN